MPLDPRIPTITLPAPAGALSRCVLCGTPYRGIANHRYPELCGQICARYVKLWERRLTGLCPWCDQVAGGPHTALSCLPGFRAMPGRKEGRCAECHKMPHAPNCALAIFERDMWRCTLCGDAIDPLLSPRHPRGPSFDHILPGSHGGGRGEANLRAAHRDCNERRGAPLPA